MPRPDHRAIAVLQLYQSCKDLGALPEAGGILDQDAELMRDFATINDRIALFRKRKHQEAEHQQAVESLKGQLNHGRRRS